MPILLAKLNSFDQGYCSFQELVTNIIQQKYYSYNLLSFCMWTLQRRLLLDPMPGKGFYSDAFWLGHLHVWYKKNVIRRRGYWCKHELCIKILTTQSSDLKWGVWACIFYIFTGQNINIIHMSAIGLLLDLMAWWKLLPFAHLRYLYFSLCFSLLGVCIYNLCVLLYKNE